MEAQHLRQRIDHVEAMADAAKSACQRGDVPEDLKQCIMTLHEQASATKHASQGQESATEDSLRKDIVQLEQTADRAMQACRNAGSSIDPRLQQAIERAHKEASDLKHDLMHTA